MGEAAGSLLTAVLGSWPPQEPPCPTREVTEKRGSRSQGGAASFLPFPSEDGRLFSLFPTALTEVLLRLWFLLRTERTAG